MAYIKLQIPAGKANPSPPVGPALGQHGLNIMDFCKQFNAKTQKDGDAVVPVIITVFQDRSFSFITKTPPVTYLIKKAMSFKSGSKMPQKDKIGTITQKQLEDIAKIKMPDLNCLDVESAKAQIAGSAKSMGLEIGK